MYFGSDERQVRKCLKIIDNEIDRIASGGLKEKALEAAKKQYVGQLLVSSENPESHALSLGKGILNFGQVNTINEIADMIRSVSAEELRSVAESISGKCSSLIFV